MCLNMLMGHIMDTSNITNYKPKDFATLLGVSVKTLQRWDSLQKNQVAFLR